MGAQRSVTSPFAARWPLVSRTWKDLEIDRAFLRWFEARLADRGPEPPEEDVLSYLAALGLYNRGWLVGCGW
ncbi:MAG: hypothetical protein JOZ98_18010 [Solirubrobacterales bacterium]|nr:hypothetical protein [Solirubrobacterales bacterium]